MSFIIFFIIFVPASIFISRLSAENRDRDFLMFYTISAWLIFTPLIAIVHYWMPFSGGGDDEVYFFLAGLPTSGLESVFDFQRFIGALEQPGYPWLLSIVQIFTGHNLLVYKLLNLFFFIMIAAIWYCIGSKIESPEFGRKIFLSILFLTPMWFYFFFTLKDMIITLFQSFFVLNVIRIWYRPAVSDFFGATTSTGALLLLRAPLVTQNAVVLLAAGILKLFAPGAAKNRTAPLLVALLALATVIPIVISPDNMLSLGIDSDHRVVGSAAMFDRIELFKNSSEFNPFIFPFVYLFIETSGLNLNTWKVFDFFWLRSVLALPWIAVVVPFFFLGLFWLFKVPSGVKSAKGGLGRLRQSRIIATPWSTVTVFIIISFTTSWIVGDTTRWRVPDMPFIASIALAGWQSVSIKRRQFIIALWICGIGASFAIFYTLKGLS